MDVQEVDEKAAELIRELAGRCTLPTGLGSLSPTIYDTAWVAMVSKVIHEKTTWRFPECFDFVLDRQKADGGWGASEEDGILNTMAAMLALKLHADTPHYLGCHIPKDIEARISKADTFLQMKLKEWSVEESVNVGFEILIPLHLQLLQEQGFSYQLPGMQALVSLNREKLARFDPQILYGTTKTTLLHSLEAFVGKIDFDKVSHRRVGGSMLGSPSSTAALLIYGSSWCDDAEEYLSMVLATGHGTDSGGVPGAFPTTTFMLCWATSTLLGNGFTNETLGSVSMLTIGDFLEQQLQAGSGLVGFAPSFLEDADDTAKTILSLNLLGRPTAPDAMVAAFEAQKHFSTYATERNPSFSANCNVLMALLSVEEPGKYSLQIQKVANFLCNLWYHGETLDKWNTCPQYSRMLLAQALVRLLYVWDAGELIDLDSGLVRHRIPIVICQVSNRTLRHLGSSQCCETTAYAVLTLTTLSSLPWFRSVELQIEAAREAGRNIIFAAMRSSLPPRSIWIEKVTYSSPYLCQIYCLAALKAVPLKKRWGSSVEYLADISEKTLNKFAQFFLQLPIFSQELEWQMKASLIEGYLFYLQLKRTRLDVYPRKDMVKDKYLEYTPLIWTVSNNLRDTPLCAAFLWDMMVISILVYQTDEYMESFVGENFAANLGPLRRLVHELCDQSNISEARVNTSLKRRSSQLLGGESEYPNPVSRVECNGPSTALVEVTETLSKFIKYVKEHSSVQRASPADSSLLSRELRTFLLAHITQIEDNTRFRARTRATANRATVFEDPTTSYFTWVQTTSADHTSCPYSFAFMTCLVGGARLGSDCFVGVRQKYLSQSLCRHLATMCRQYNDYGSIARDRAEENINSVNFPEFHAPSISDAGLDGNDADHDEAKETAIKAALFEIAQFERESLDLAMSRLKAIVSPRVWKALRLFVDVTDVYGQIYVARDITSRIQ